MKELSDQEWDRIQRYMEGLEAANAALLKVAEAAARIYIPERCTCTADYLSRDLVDPACEFCDQKYEWTELRDALRVAREAGHLKGEGQTKDGHT